MMKSFSIFTAGLLIVGVTVIAFRSPLIAQVTGKPPAAKKEAGTKQPEAREPTEAEKKAAREKAENDRLRRQRDRQLADSLLVGAAVMHANMRSVRADMSLKTNIGERSFTATGHYVQGSNNRIRLELDLKLDSGVLVTKAKLLQVCDGSVLRTLRSIGDRHRLTRRDVKQILGVAAGQGRGVNQTMVTELGLGGIQGIIASLRNTMDFDSVRLDKSGPTVIRILEGTWNPTFQQHLRGLSSDRRSIPEFVPDKVRAYIDDKSILRAIEYLKYDPESKTDKPMMTLKFENIKRNAKTTDKDFVFKAPPEVFQEDVTERYLRALTPKEQPQ